MTGTSTLAAGIALLEANLAIAKATEDFVRISNAFAATVTIDLTKPFQPEECTATAAGYYDVIDDIGRTIQSGPLIVHRQHPQPWHRKDRQRQAHKRFARQIIRFMCRALRISMNDMRHEGYTRHGATVRPCNPNRTTRPISPGRFEIAP